MYLQTQEILREMKRINANFILENDGLYLNWQYLFRNDNLIYSRLKAPLPCLHDLNSSIFVNNKQLSNTISIFLITTDAIFYHSE